jgi:hypothetical protein
VTFHFNNLFPLSYGVPLGTDRKSVDSTKFLGRVSVFVGFVIDIFDLQKITAKAVWVERAETAGDFLNRVGR